MAGRKTNHYRCRSHSEVASHLNIWRNCVFWMNSKKGYSFLIGWHLRHMRVGSCTDSLFYDYDYSLYLTREENLIEIKNIIFKSVLAKTQTKMPDRTTSSHT